MTPFEIATALYRELSPVAPRLAAALNRALIDIGEGSALILPHDAGPTTLHEQEQISVKEGERSAVFSRIICALQILEEHSRWRVIIDKKPGRGAGILELSYTLYRENLV
jgi:hypothetical protein